MDEVFTLELSRHQLGVVANTIRERLHADRDGSNPLDASEREELNKTLEALQGASTSSECA